MEVSTTTLSDVPELHELGERLRGQKYAFVDESVLDLREDGVHMEVWAWLREEMSR